MQNNCKRNKRNDKENLEWIVRWTKHLSLGILERKKRKDKENFQFKIFRCFDVVTADSSKYGNTRYSWQTEPGAQASRCFKVVCWRIVFFSSSTKTSNKKCEFEDARIFSSH